MLSSVMDRLGVTQREIADAIGIDRAAFSRKVRGHVRWYLNEAQEVVEYLSRYEPGLCMDDLFGRPHMQEDVPEQSPGRPKNDGASEAAIS